MQLSKEQRAYMAYGGYCSGAGGGAGHLPPCLSCFGPVLVNRAEPECRHWLSRLFRVQGRFRRKQGARAQRGAR